jgi:hypothetical protein
MDVDQFVAANGCEYVYHMAEKGSWDSIQRIGLLSTSRLLDACGTPVIERSRIEASHRPTKVVVKHPKCGDIVIRDQDPMTDRPESGIFLKQLLEGGTSPAEWFMFLNGKVFFWVSYSDFLNMLCARLYRNRAHWILKVDTKSLLRQHINQASICDQNSGSLYSRRTRGRSTFVPLLSSPVRSGIKELAIEDGVADIAQHTVSVTECVGTWKNGEKVCEVVSQIWP